MLVGSRAYSVNAQRWLKPFSDAFVEASPAGGAFTFTVGGRASVADGAVAECGEGVFFDGVLHLLAGAGGHGVELHDVKVAEDVEVVEFGDFGFLARVVLLAADSVDPDRIFVSVTSCPV